MGVEDPLPESLCWDVVLSQEFVLDRIVISLPGGCHRGHSCKACSWYDSLRKSGHWSLGHLPAVAVASKVSRKAPMSSVPSWNFWSYETFDHTPHPVEESPYISATICAILWSFSVCHWSILASYSSGLVCSTAWHFSSLLVVIWSTWSICERNRSMGSVAAGEAPGVMPWGCLKSCVDLLSLFILT